MFTAAWLAFGCGFPEATDFEVLAPAPEAFPFRPFAKWLHCPGIRWPSAMLHLHGSVQIRWCARGLRFAGWQRLHPHPAGLQRSVANRGRVVDVAGFAELDRRRAQDHRRQTGCRQILSPIPRIRTGSSLRGRGSRLSPEEAASAIPVHVRATVTYINPATNAFFVQDQTGPTYVYAPRIASSRCRRAIWWI
jgi:hypothetical protein